MSKKFKFEPTFWKEQLDNIKIMRKNLDAPVDVMGCEALSTGDESLSPQEQRLCTLISLMLSSQTKDEVTGNAIKKLQENCKPFSTESILSVSDEELGKIIYPVSFWKTKVKNIKKTAQILKEKYDGEIPNTVDKLIELPGVGPKMAYICMSTAWNQTVGIGVDTHVHRIVNRLGWTRQPTKLPEQTRKELEEWLPMSYWETINKLLVGFGQQICKPLKPNCTECLNQNNCPFAQKSQTTKKATSKRKVTNSSK